MLKQLQKTLRSLGPGFILAALVLGPGSITVASRIGSEYGHSFLWVIVLATIFMITYTSMGARFGVTSKLSMLQTISNNYGRWFAVVIGISAFLSASSFQFGNNVGIGIGMEGITGINERVWPLVFTFLGIIFIFWAKNLYRLLEQVMKVMVLIMILAFFINLILIKPEIAPVARGFIPMKFPRESLSVVAALMATSFSLAAALYQSYLTQDKGWKKKDLKHCLKDTYMGILLLAIISATVLITSASALHPTGIVVNSAADMAKQMEALFGNSAKIVFSVGLCAAAFSSMMVNGVIGGGMLVAIFFKGNYVYALILAQASSMLVVPLIAIGLFLVLNNKQVMGDLRNTLLQNAIAILGFIVISMMVYFMYQNIVAHFSTP